jgi:hypothetical protein
MLYPCSISRHFLIFRLVGGIELNPRYLYFYYSYMKQIVLCVIHLILFLWQPIFGLFDQNNSQMDETRYKVKNTGIGIIEIGQAKRHR